MELGVVEGFYGPLWPMADRLALVRRLGAHGYGAYHYAPKADPGVRSDWRTPWCDAALAALTTLATTCRAAGLRFGIGLTPAGAALPLGEADRRAFAGRLAQLDAIGIDDLLIGFDDERGDTPDLAARQAELVHWAAARSRATRAVVCPTWYSDDPLLDRLFGERPADYLGELGRRLDPAVQVYWAGEAICPAAIRVEHVERVAERLRRPPRLWDNYPVNDGPAMAPHLHLRAFTGRSAALAGVISGHAINPALQPVLTAVPALTLPALYRDGPSYDPRAAFREAAREVLGADLARLIEDDLPLLQEAGRDDLGEAPGPLRARYAALDHPAAREIVAWLDGHYGAAPVPTQPGWP